MTLDLGFTQWAVLAATASAVGMAWGRIRGVLNFMSRLVVRQVVIREMAYDAVSDHCWINGKTSPFSVRVYGARMSWLDPKKRVELVGYETMSREPTLLWFGWCPVLACPPASTRPGDQSGLSMVSEHPGSNDHGMRLCFIRGTFDVENFVQEALRKYNLKFTQQDDSSSHRFSVSKLGFTGTGIVGSKSANSSAAAEYPEHPSNPLSQLNDLLKKGQIRLLTWGSDDLVRKSATNALWQQYVFPEAVMLAMREVRLWLDNRDWFVAKGVPWRLGWLLHGPPGTGKSTLVSCLGQHFDLPVYSFSLADMSNSLFAASWNVVKSNAPCIALIEDIDAVFHGRENIAKTDVTMGVTFDCLLNTIGGVEPADGVFLIVTTNHIEHLDPALGVPENGRSSRPGRLDRAIELKGMQESERIKLARNMLETADVSEVVAAGANDSAAQFQARCSAIALQKFWDSKLVQM